MLKNLFSRTRPAPHAAIDVAALLRQADAALQQGRWSAAQQLAQQLMVEPDHEADACHVLGVVAYQCSDPEKALALVESSIALNPKAAHFHNTLGKILVSLGRFADAAAAYERAITLAPQVGGYFMNYAAARKFSAADMPLIEAIEKQLPAIAEDSDHRINFQFALGKALDDCALYDRAFPYFKQANDAKFASQPFAMEPLLEYVTTLRSVFDDTFVARHRPPVRRDDIRPIFIVGMPRSGSTLLESLLCRDPDIIAGGELRALDIVVNDVARIVSNSLPYPQCLREVATIPLRELARIYRDNLTPAISTARRFTDKYLYNFLNVGLIALLFPQASIIQIRRHPLDVCLSCYLMSFADAHGFTYDIETLCRYYGQYEVIMAHWHKVLPDLIIDVEYRDLAEAAEETIGTVRERLELCAQIENASDTPAHAIQTASAWQARQPIYKSSLHRWRNYRNHISPFVEALRNAGVNIDLEPTTLTDSA
ncbi:MAG: sulfotransferase [Betaproteobacteria bacterium]|nr:sulfotransferase [Betaproteobacteria bacterium]